MQARRRVNILPLLSSPPLSPSSVSSLVLELPKRCPAVKTGLKKRRRKERKPPKHTDTHTHAEREREREREGETRFHTHLLSVQARFGRVQKHAHEADFVLLVFLLLLKKKKKKKKGESIRMGSSFFSLSWFLSESISSVCLAGTHRLTRFVRNENGIARVCCWKSRFFFFLFLFFLLSLFFFFFKTRRGWLIAVWSCWWLLLDEFFFFFFFFGREKWSRSPPRKAALLLLYFCCCCCCCFLSLSSPTSLLLPKIIASLCHSVSLSLSLSLSLSSSLYASRRRAQLPIQLLLLPLSSPTSLPKKKKNVFNGDAALVDTPLFFLCLSLSLWRACVPLSVPFWRSVTFCTIFFSPQTIHVGGLENKTEREGGGGEDPGEYRG